LSESFVALYANISWSSASAFTAEFGYCFKYASIFAALSAGAVAVIASLYTLYSSAVMFTPPACGCASKLDGIAQAIASIEASTTFFITRAPRINSVLIF
jgi:hypothetical protein